MTYPRAQTRAKVIATNKYKKTLGFKNLVSFFAYTLHTITYILPTNSLGMNESSDG